MRVADVIVVAWWVESTNEPPYPEPGGLDQVRNPRAGATIDPGWPDKLAIPATVSELTVEKVLKDDLAVVGSSIEVRQTGGIQGGVLYADDSTTFFEDAAHTPLLLFLRASSDGKYFPLNPTEGAWTESGSRWVSIGRHQPELRLHSLQEVRDEVKRSGSRPRGW